MEQSHLIVRQQLKQQEREKPEAVKAVLYLIKFNIAYKTTTGTRNIHYLNTVNYNGHL